jgi:hypothetical protein
VQYHASLLREQRPRQGRISPHSGPEAHCSPGRWGVWWTGLDEAVEQEGSEDMAAGERRFAEEWAEPVELEVAPLPCWEGLREEERQRAVRRLVEQVEAEARARGTPVLGARAVRAQHPHHRPEQLKRSPRPLGYASTHRALNQHTPSTGLPSSRHDGARRAVTLDHLGRYGLDVNTYSCVRVRNTAGNSLVPNPALIARL